MTEATAPKTIENGAGNSPFSFSGTGGHAGIAASNSPQAV